MPRYQDIINSLENYECASKPIPKTCCASCMFHSGFQFAMSDPMMLPVALTLTNGYLLAEADAASSKREKWLYYTMTGLVNLYIFYK